MCTPSSLLTHRADRCLHHCGCAWRGVGVDVGELGGWDGEGMEGEGGSPSATGPLLPSNSPHFAFLRPSLPLLLLSLSPSHLFPKFFHFLLLKAKKIRSLPPHQPPLKFCRLQNLHFPTKAAPISPHPFPRTLRILLFLRSARCWRGELGAPRVFPRCTFFYSTCIYHRDHSCAEGSPEAGSK